MGAAKPLELFYSKMCIQRLGPKIYELDQIAHAELADITRSACEWFMHAVRLGDEDVFLCYGKEGADAWFVTVVKAQFEGEDVQFPEADNTPSNGQFVELRRPTRATKVHMTIAHWLRRLPRAASP